MKNRNLEVLSTLLPFFAQIVSIFLLNFDYTNGVAVEESATGAIISFPEVLDGDLYNVTWEVEPAAFGFADYGGTLEAWLVLPLNTSYHTECDTEPSTKNTYIHYINDYLGSDALWILVLDRGDCYFATKVYNAEQLGAAGVILIDNKNEEFFPMWEPDNFEQDITIPSVEMKMSNGSVLMKHLGVTNWDPNDVSNTTYPTAGLDFPLTKVIIEWGLPHEDDRVEWELWTSSNDERTVAFKHNFKWAALTMDYANDTVFTPHYYILNGSHWSCTSQRHGDWQCGNQCTNSGRYCAVDPEYDLNSGVSGEDVVRENLRQVCIWNFTTFGDKTIHNESVWWDYSNLWNDKCFNGTEDESTFNDACSYKQMAYLENNGVTGLSAYVNNCIETSGGYGYNDGVNTLMEYEVTFREDLSVYILPSFRVNEFMIYGEVDCDVVTEAGCSVLDSICSGFLDGTEPDICSLTPSPTVYTLNCTASQKDCNGDCFGTKQTDRCGNCLETTSRSWNSCVGCDNVTNSVYQTNPCGYCLDSTEDDFETYGEGCDGVCNSNYATDDCGICRWIYSFKWNGCVGCDGVAFSGKEWNECGRCILNTTENFNDYGKDCSGTCDGSKETDQCGQCLETSDSSWDSCISSPNVTESVTVIDRREDSSLSTAVIIIGIVAFIVIVVAGVVIYKLYKKQQQQSKQFESILKTYTLMDENPGQAQGSKSKNPFKKDRMAVPTEDIDEASQRDVSPADDGNAVV